METIVSIKPLFATLIPAVSVILILLSRKSPNLREAWSFIAAISTFLIVVSMLPFIMNGGIIEYTAFTILPGIEFKLRVDGLGIFFALTASFLWILATAYSIGYMRAEKENSQTRYFSCFAVAICSAIGVAFAANLFVLYLFYEVLSITTYPLVAHHEDDAAFAGSHKYVTYLVGLAKTALLAAIIITYMTTGTLDFRVGGIYNTGMPALLVTISYICFLVGFAKSGMMPFHNWLPGAMVAPTPVSALLHAVAVVKVGVFSVVRIMISVYGFQVMDFFHLGLPTAIFASVTITLASIIALTKNDLKARLAYSTISQLSYIIFGVALLSPSGALGGIIHIGNHAISKITLFFCAGSIYVASHIREVDRLDGIATKMPFTMAAFTIGAFSMISVPLTAGFTSKWFLTLGTMEVESMGLLMVLLASTVLNAAYFLPVVYRAYFRPAPIGDPHFDRIKEAPPFVVVPLSITALLTVFFGIYPDLFISIIKTFLAGVV
ncbi:Na(+) H(+) antiporter subunit A [hydrothermal vent metagenome]|uniref:Na(+) H(+) antiporter subunit A n=1 Tax=hydrothermal vent metagenome TaxID=652676 RepID=A0A3B0V6T0_9ZZZZ